jgi:DNA-binding response OmpR family regulator
VTESLRQTGHVVEVAANFGQAQEKIALYRYDCVLLDLMLPIAFSQVAGPVHLFRAFLIATRG